MQCGGHLQKPRSKHTPILCPMTPESVMGIFGARILGNQFSMEILKYFLLQREQDYPQRQHLPEYFLPQQTRHQ